VLSWLSRNFRTILWALALSISVWVAAVTSADPDEAHIFQTPVPLEIIGQDPSLVIISEIPTAVEINLRAPRSVWTELEADPHSVRAILDLSGLSTGEHLKELQIQVNVRPVRIVSVTPASLSVVLEPLATLTMNVSLSQVGQPAVGYKAGEAIFDPTQILIAGARSRVEKVKRARVSVSLDGVRENIDQALPVEALDEKGQLINGLTITPATVHVTLPISQQGGYRDMAVKVVVHGQVARGYRLTDISVFPPVVTVFSSNPELVNNLPGVLETQPLDLSNANDDITTRLGLDLPAGISAVGEQTVLIQAGVTAIESSLTIENEQVEILGLASGLKSQVSPETVGVIVSGPLPLLDTLTRQDVRVTVDVTGLEAGTYQREPKVEILIADVVKESILPGTIEVVITEPGAPTPTPGP
jgi:YbbR domain-containing protein